MTAALRATIARSLEAGRSEGPFSRLWARLAASKWRAADSTHAAPAVISIAGSRLGGSLATPLVLAVAELLSRRGARVAVVTRANLGRARAPRVVSRDDDPADVGDEGLWLARALPAVTVVTARTPSVGLAFAAQRADVVIADGRAPASVRVLIHDPRGPAACPPSGDMRAPLSTLHAWATHVLSVDALSLGVEVPDVSGDVLLATAIARPHRVVEATGSLSVVHHVAFPDHGGPGFVAAVASALTRHPARVVVCTEKCATWLPSRVSGREVVPLRARVVVPGSLAAVL